MRLTVPAFAALLATGLVTSPLAGQTLGVEKVQSSSPNPELPAPRGWGVFGEMEVREGWLAGLSYARYHDATYKSGVVCQVYSPRIGCGTEGVSSSAQMGGLRFTAQRILRVGWALQLGAGVGISFSSLSMSSAGDSGRRADLQLPHTGQIGYLALGSVSVTPVPAVPVHVVGRWLAHWVDFRGCSDPQDPNSGYAPFCGVDRFDEIHLGLSLTLPNLGG
ncbi:MAG: hypothetical protein PVJ02_12680 [Gemmatimonadota bacterium]|jgi:hypothetical protein